MTKIVEILESTVHNDYTGKYRDLADARAHFSDEILIVEAPDYVFPGWGYNRDASGDDRFVHPTVGKGMAYDDETGSVWIPENIRRMEREQLHQATTNDTMEALRKLRDGDTSIDWQAWLDQLDAYNRAITETKTQEGYPLKVTYPEYPTKPTPQS